VGVLVVVADGPLRTPPAVRARLTMVRPHLTALVTMPYIPRWREIDQALEQVRLVPCVPRDQVPKWLRPWAGHPSAPQDPGVAGEKRCPGPIVMQGP
jgi:hypothetical protein